MTEEKNFEGIAAYVGVSAPETPKYLLTNNFLLHYFKEAKNDSKHLNFELFKSSGVLYTEDSENEELLQSLVYKHASSDNSFGFSSLFDLEVQKTHAGMKSLETCSSFGS